MSSNSIAASPTTESFTVNSLPNGHTLDAIVRANVTDAEVAGFGSTQHLVYSPASVPALDR